MDLTIPQHQLTLSGNTAGALAALSSGTVTIAGGNNITVSQAGNAVTISGANVGGAQTGISGISASDTLYTSGTVRFTGVGGGVTVSSNTGQRVDISVAAQSVQPETQTFIAGISASNTLYTSGNVRFTGSQAVTVRSGTGQLVVIDAPAQSVQPETQTFVAGIQNSQTTYTSGTVNLSVVAGQLTIRSTTGQAFQFSASQSVQPETQTAISGIANSQTTYTSGTVSLSELGAITIRSTTGNQFQLSVNAQTTQTQGVLSAGVSTGGNTSGNTTVNTGSRLVFAGGNNITLSQGTAAGATTVTISGPNVGGAQTGISGIANSETTYTSGSVTLSALGAITIRSTTGQHFQLSVNSQTAQTGISGIANSQTTYTSGTVSLSELGAITIRSTTGNQYQLSVNAQTTQTQGILSAGVSTGGNTAGNTTVNTGSRFVLVATGNATASQATAAGASTVTISVGTQTVQTQGVLSAGVSNVGNTSGNTTVNTGSRLVFAGGNNITVSQGTAAGATTITISAPNLGAGAFSGGVSNLGNSAGDTGITGTRLILVGSDNITLSQATDANGGTVSFVGGGGGGFSAGMSTEGNTAGNTGVTGTRLVFVGTGPISLSQTTGAAGGTLSINAPATSSLSATGNIQISTNGSTISVGDGGNVIDFWDNLVPGASTGFVLPNATMHIWPLNPVNANFPGFMSVSTVMFDISGTVSTAAPWTRSVSLGFYTQVNSTQLSLLASASTTFGTSAGNMNVNDSFAGRRWLTFHSSQFNASPNFHEGSDYFMGLWERTSSGSHTFTYQGQLLPYYTGIRSGFINAASVTNTTLGQFPFLGNYSASFTTAMPGSLAASDVNKSNATAISLPRIIFNNLGTNIV